MLVLRVTLMMLTVLAMLMIMMASTMMIKLVNLREMLTM